MKMRELQPLLPVAAEPPPRDTTMAELCLGFCIFLAVIAAVFAFVLLV